MQNIMQMVQENWKKLAESVTVTEDRIIDASGHVIEDAPMYELDLIVRAYNALDRHGKCFMTSPYGTLMISDLLRISPENLLRIQNLGRKGVEDIIRKVDNWLKTHQTCYTAKDEHIAFVTHGSFLSFMKRHEFDAVSMDQLQAVFPGSNKSRIMDVIWDLVDGVTLVWKEGTVRRPHRSFFRRAVEEAASDSSYITERHLDILRCRIRGETLAETGRKMGLSGERIRQLEKKTFMHLTKDEEIFSEDRWKYLYTTYSISRDLFISGLNRPRRTWYYLSYRYCSGTLDPALAMEDPEIPEDVRLAVAEYVHTGKNSA